MNIQEILLERYNDIRDELRPYKNNSSMFIQYSDVLKLGINPSYHVSMGSPLGIYAYPLKEIWKNIIDDTIPSFSERKYIILFKITKGNFLNTATYTLNDFYIDVEKLKKMFKDDKLILNNDLNTYTINSLIAAVKSKFTIKLLLQLTETIANIISLKNYTITWAKILRNLGYDGIIDRNGTGTIYHTEPIQAVFFSTKYIKIIKIFNNIRKHKKINNLQNIKNFSKIKKLLIDNGEIYDFIVYGTSPHFNLNQNNVIALLKKLFSIENISYIKRMNINIPLLIKNSEIITKKNKEYLIDLYNKNSLNNN